MNTHLIKIKYHGATNYRGSRVKLTSARSNSDAISRPYDDAQPGAFEQGKKLLESLGYAVLCSGEMTDCYFACVREFVPLREAQADMLGKSLYYFSGLVDGKTIDQCRAIHMPAARATLAIKHGLSADVIRLTKDKVAL